MNRAPILWTAGLVLLAGCAAPAPRRAGDEPGASGPDEVRQDQDLFQRALDASGFTKEENYFPEFSSTRVAFRGSIDLRAGSAWVYVMDGSATRWVFNKSFSGAGVRSIDFVSDSGDPGTWMISFCFQRFTGSLTLNVTPASDAGKPGDAWRGGSCPA